MIERHGDVTEADGAEAAVITLEHLRHQFIKGNVTHEWEEIRQNEWRQMEVDALTAAIIELSKSFSDEGKREIACCCQSTEIREAILALCVST